MEHIGDKIKEIVEKRGMTKAELARRMNMTSSNIHKIFLRKTIDTGLLAKLSQLLEHNFFAYYPAYSLKKNENKSVGEPDEVSFYYEKNKLHYENQIKELSKEISYLKEIIAMLKEKKSGSGKQKIILSPKK